MTIPETQVVRIASDVVSEAFTKLPFDAQSSEDKDLAEHYLLKQLNSQVGPRLDKVEKKLKEKIKAGQASGEATSKNYKRTVEFGTPRRSFDKDAYIALVAEKLAVPKHKLVELAQNEGCFKESATPISLNLEYIGDIPK